MKRREITQDEFLRATGGKRHHDERHEPWGAVLLWAIKGRLFEERQPDIGSVTWHVCE